jgi:Trk K+ transport system NAD-binding subunit
MNLSWRRLRRRSPRLRELQAGLRDTLVLLNEFKGTLFGFTITFVIGGWLYFEFSKLAGDPRSLAESIFLVLSMVFLQANTEFPAEWYRQIFFFAMPVIGLALLARGADFGVLLFNRHSRGEAWQMAVASTYSNHVVLVGLGHLGFRVAKELHNLGDDVLVVERDPEADLLAEAEALKIPIIKADATKPETLQAAGVPRARVIIVCTSNDTMNLQMAMKVRAMNSKARVLVRVFDEDFAKQIENQFGIDQVFSASTLAAPAIAGAATQSDVTSPIALAGRTLSLARFNVNALAGKTIEAIENEFDCTIVLLERHSKSDLHPHNDLTLAAGDQIAIFAEPPTLNKLSRANR